MVQSMDTSTMNFLCDNEPIILTNCILKAMNTCSKCPQQPGCFSAKKSWISSSDKSSGLHSSFMNRPNLNHCRNASVVSL